MRTRTHIVAVTLSFTLVVLLSVDLLYAQQRRDRGMGMQQQGSGRPQLQERSAALEFSNGPFDPWVKQLPPFFAGYEPGLLYNRVRSRERGPDLLYAVRFGAPERFYDPRTQIVSLYCRLSGILRDGKEDETLRGLTVKYLPQVDNRYSGADYSGARIEIEELKFQEYIIVFANFLNFPLERPGSPLALQASGKDRGKAILGAGEAGWWARDAIAGSIRLTAAEAKQQAWNRISVLLVFSPTPPYASRESVEEQPTAGTTGQRLAQYNYIHTRLLGVWFYDFETGKILLKIEPGKAQPPSP